MRLIEQTELKELMELFCTANALISNDCGLTDLATLTSISKFIIFGPESPQIFPSWGRITGPSTQDYPVHHACLFLIIENQPVEIIDVCMPSDLMMSMS